MVVLPGPCYDNSEVRGICPSGGRTQSRSKDGHAGDSVPAGFRSTVSLAPTHSVRGGGDVPATLSSHHARYVIRLTADRQHVNGAPDDFGISLEKANRTESEAQNSDHRQTHADQSHQNAPSKKSPSIGRACLHGSLCRSIGMSFVADLESALIPVCGPL
jgi:hypothetical protein